MPLFKTIALNKNTSIYIWKITESLDELEAIDLNTNSVARLTKMKSTQHKKGYLSVRFLLKAAGYTDEDLYYLENGKPLLKNDFHISISHSFDFSAIIISSEFEVGIDIEQNRDKILRIAHRFTDEKTEDIFDLTQIWAAKEALYKIHPCGGMSFKNDLKVSLATKSTGIIDTPELKGNYTICYDAVENYSLAYAFPNENN